MTVEEMVVALEEPGAGVLIGLTRLGRPVWLSAGADDPDEETEEDGEDEDEDEEDDEEDEDEDGEGDEDDDAYEPPSKAELAELVAAKKRANHEAAARRRLLEQLGIKFNKSTGEAVDPDYLDRLLDTAATLNGAGPAAARRGDANGAGHDDSDSGGKDDGRLTQADVDRQVAREVSRAEARAEAKYKPVLATVALERALDKAGWSGASPDLALRMIDLQEVDVEDGEIVGIDDQIEDLKGEFPQLFTGRRGSGRARRGAEDVDGGDKRRRTPPPKKLTWEERIAAQMDGRG